MSFAQTREFKLRGTLLIDTHMHIYESKKQGSSHKASYVISEYGSGPVTLSVRGGDVDEALEAMAAAGFSYAVVANLFYTAASGEGIVELCPGAADGSAVPRDAASARERLTGYNRWACGLSRVHPQLLPLIALDPWVMSSLEMIQHLHEMTSGFGARGVKLHPVAQRFAADDERLLSVYNTCAELGVYVLAHSGTSPNNTFAEPA